MNDASLSDSSAVVPGKTRIQRYAPWLLIAIAAVIYASDQLVKNWVVSNLPEGESIPVIGEFLQWHFVRNPGAAFSMASGATWIFTILSAVVVGVIVWQIRRLRSVSWAVFLGLLLGGVLGNLTDRLTRDPGFPVGHVIDFILTPWMMPAIYNIADMGIVVGMVIFVLITFLGISLDGTRSKSRTSEPADSESNVIDETDDNAVRADDDDTSALDVPDNESDSRGSGGAA
ncbi:MAG: signal peptidase II [Leucobacter sp.]